MSLAKEVSVILDEIDAMFTKKNEQYKSTEDELANFTRGALIMGECDNEVGRFEALKAYVAKHIAHVYNNRLYGHKVDESLMDMAVYSILGLVMYRRLKKEMDNANT